MHMRSLVVTGLPPQGASPRSIFARSSGESFAVGTFGGSPTSTMVVHAFSHRPALAFGIAAHTVPAKPIRPDNVISESKRMVYPRA